MDKQHIEQLAIWIADNIAPIEKADMPLIFKDETQDLLWKEVCELLRYKD